MGVSDVRRVLRVNGQLCWNPTSLSSGSFPWGGVGLGVATGKEHEVRGAPHIVRGEEFGGSPIDAIYPGKTHVFAAILRAWDTDAIAASFLDRADGAVTGKEVIKSRATTVNTRAGTMMSTLAGILYFSPDSDSDPGVIFYNALPMKPDTSKTAYHLAEQWGLPMLWIATPDATDRMVNVGVRKDLSV